MAVRAVLAAVVCILFVVGSHVSHGSSPGADILTSADETATKIEQSVAAGEAKSPPSPVDDLREDLKEAKAASEELHETLHQVAQREPTGSEVPDAARLTEEFNELRSDRHASEEHVNRGLDQLSEKLNQAHDTVGDPLTPPPPEQEDVTEGEEQVQTDDKELIHDDHPPLVYPPGWPEESHETLQKLKDTQADVTSAANKAFARLHEAADTVTQATTTAVDNMKETATEESPEEAADPIVGTAHEALDQLEEAGGQIAAQVHEELDLVKKEALGAVGRCLNNCSDAGECVLGICICHKDRYGEDCSREEPEQLEAIPKWLERAIASQLKLQLHVPLDQLQLVGSHAAYNTRARNYRFPNQKYTLLDQLLLGARYLQFDVHFLPKQTVCDEWKQEIKERQDEAEIALSKKSEEEEGLVLLEQNADIMAEAAKLENEAGLLSPSSEPESEPEPEGAVGGDALPQEEPVGEGELVLCKRDPLLVKNLEQIQVLEKELQVELRKLGLYGPDAGCPRTSQTLRAAFEEVNSFLHTNKGQVVVIRVDGLKVGYGTIFTTLAKDVFGEAIVLPAEVKDGEFPTLKTATSAGSRLVFVVGEELPDVDIAFHHTIPDHVASARFFLPAPLCRSAAAWDQALRPPHFQAVHGDVERMKIGDLDLFDGPLVSGLLTEDVARDVSECGLIPAFDNYDVKTAEGAIWSWAPEEPAGPGCALMMPGGRWRSHDCNASFPYACQHTSQPDEWILSFRRGSWHDGEAACPTGFVLAVPTNGWHNWILSKMMGEGKEGVWLKYSSHGGAAWVTGEESLKNPIQRDEEEEKTLKDLEHLDPRTELSDLQFAQGQLVLWEKRRTVLETTLAKYARERGDKEAEIDEQVAKTTELQEQLAEAIANIEHLKVLEEQLKLSVDHAEAERAQAQKHGETVKQAVLAQDALLAKKEEEEEARKKREEEKEKEEEEARAAEQKMEEEDHAKEFEKEKDALDAKMKKEGEKMEEKIDEKVKKVAEDAKVEKRGAQAKLVAKEHDFEEQKKEIKEEESRLEEDKRAEGARVRQAEQDVQERTKGEEQMLRETARQEMEALAQEAQRAEGELCTMRKEQQEQLNEKKQKAHEKALDSLRQKMDEIDEAKMKKQKETKEQEEKERRQQEEEAWQKQREERERARDEEEKQEDAALQQQIETILTGGAEASSDLCDSTQKCLQDSVLDKAFQEAYASRCCTPPTPVPSSVPCLPSSSPRENCWALPSMTPEPSPLPSLSPIPPPRDIPMPLPPLVIHTRPAPPPDIELAPCCEPCCDKPCTCTRCMPMTMLETEDASLQ
eukprot:TRINITY_DN2992_c0_g1_i1.p1 TRINITY_DN2992_c0_g1~~TRINITY_DN2992_c0_g1_i1.p1  ORF type:complete len:1318 (-),score=457.66 TRINITY_DN2992_c0_g1_i1:23-3952(-)